MISDETKLAVQTARDMLATGIRIQATGEATDAIVTGIIQSLLDHIDKLEADLKCAIAVGWIAVGWVAAQRARDALDKDASK